MVTLTLQLGIEMTILCVQCKKPMAIEGSPGQSLAPVLKCPDCGFRIQIVHGLGRQQLPGMRQLPGELRPKPRT